MAGCQPSQLQRYRSGTEIESTDRRNLQAPRQSFTRQVTFQEVRPHLNRTTGHWYSVKLFENTLAVRSERSRTSGAVEEQAGGDSGGLRLRSATLRPNSKSSTASEKVSESSVV